MDFKFKINTGLKPNLGKLLIAEPLLEDPYFQRAVVYLCGHNAEGSFGFILNKKLDKTLDYLIDPMNRKDIPVFLGGPVDNSTIHFLHRQGSILGGDKIDDQYYFGGDFDLAISMLEKNKLDQNNIRFFVGYSGWGDFQLEDEIEKNSWLVADINKIPILTTPVDTLWKKSILTLKEEFHPLISLPTDPSLN